MQKILLVEDDETMVSLLETLLTMEGFQVNPVVGDSDIFQVIKSSKADVILLDVYLGKQNGMELLSNLRQDEELDKLRIIMTSGIDHSEQCNRLGADGFLLKPFTPDELLRLLKAEKHPRKKK